MFQEFQSLYTVSWYKSNVVDLMSWGSLFQAEAAATTKARSTIEERPVALMASKDDAAERRCFQPGTVIVLP